MKLILRAFIFLSVIIFINSCTIQKRIYKNGYFIESSIFNKSDFNSSGDFVQEPIKLVQNEKRIIKRIYNDNCKSEIKIIDSIVFTEHLDHRISLSSSIKIKSTVNLKELECINLKKVTSLKLNFLNKKKSKVKLNLKRFDKDDLLSLLGTILRWIFFLAFLCLIALAIHAFFPIFSFIVSFLIGIAFIAFLLLIFFSYYFSHSVC